MEVNEELEVFARITKEEATKQHDELKTKIEDEYNQACEGARAKAQLRAETIINEETNRAEQQKNREILTASTEARRSLIELRKQLTDDLFSGVLNKIADYIETDKYVEGLLADVKDITKLFEGQEVDITICGRDMALESKIKAINGVRNVVESKVDFIGGLKAEIAGKSVVIDRSYKQRLEDERSKFVGFKITE